MVDVEDEVGSDARRVERAREGGVLARRGHTESALDLCALAGLPRAGVLCELVEDDEEGGTKDGKGRLASKTSITEV